MADAQIVLKTTMSCAKCVAKVQPALEAFGIRARFDMNSPDKTVSFVGNEAQRAQAIAALEKLGYKAGSLAAEASPSLLATYRPLAIVALFLLGTTALVEVRAEVFDPMRAMNVFMGGFFLFFSFFKFLDLTAFADAFASYDLLAKRSRAYAVAYPFIELGLGVAYVLGIFPFGVNLLTLALMALGNVGVWSVLRKKQTIQCACLGTVFKLPMTKVTLFENSLMFLMALLNLLSL